MKLLFLLLGFCCWLVNESRAAAPRPNIIFVLTDDLGYGDYGVFFQNALREKGDHTRPWHLTPQIDAMAAAGVQLRQYYCPAPVCAPSRASLLLGVHQGHANVRDNQFDKALEQNHTLASVLKGAGYATAAIGKWGLQGLEGNSPATWPAYPTKRGFDFFFGYVRHKDGHAHYPKEDGKEVWENERELSADLAGCYTTDLFTARAKKWIAEQHAARPEQPFFLYLAYDTPHAKLQLPPGPWPTGGVRWEGRPGAMINTASGQPDSYLHPDYATATWDHDGDPATPEQPWPNVYKRYATDVRRIDDCLGDLRETLRQMGIDRETLVVFTTDNGPSRESYLPENYEPTFFHSFGPFDGIKRDCWEGGIRAGAIVQWPAGVPAGRVSELPCQGQDWMATLAELAGVPAPARADGVSLVPALTGHGEQKTPTVYVEYMVGEKPPGYKEFEAARRNQPRRQMQAVREGDFIGVRYDVRAAGDPFEIYDVVHDPKEALNLAAEQTELQRRLHERVLELRRPDAGAPRSYDREPMAAVQPGKVAAGLRWQACAGAQPWLARVEDLSAVAQGEAPGLAVPAGTLGDVLFSGYLSVPTEGAYTFAMPAAQVALLRLHEATVLDGGFAPGEGERSGQVWLRAGLHPFRFYGRTGEGTPRLEWSGPGVERQAIPAKAFSH